MPAGGVSYSGLDTRIDLDAGRVRLQKFAILDEHGEPLNVAGELAVHERQVGAVNITIESDNFEVIDNELGDVGVDSKLTITGELRRPRVAATSGSRRRGSRSTGSCSCSTTRTPEELPDGRVGGADGRGRGSAQEATTSALAKAEARRAVRRRRRRGRSGRRSGAGRRVRRRSSSTCGSASRTTSCCAAGSCGRADRPARRSAT